MGSGGLRERKKAMTRGTVEETALRLFLDRGYDQVRLEDICAESTVSLRTFFRYFTSKEDLVLGRLRAHLDEAERLFAERPAKEPLRESLRAVVGQTVEDYATGPERELTRLRLVTTTPALGAGLTGVFAGFERLVRRVAAKRLRSREDARRPRLVAAAAVAAFRVGLEMWVEYNGRRDLANLVLGNLDDLTKGVVPVGTRSGGS
jgi:AcrR family transcriptional regulator